MTKRTLLVFGQILDMFDASRKLISSSSVKTMQVCPRIKWESVELPSFFLSQSQHLLDTWLIDRENLCSLDTCYLSRFKKEIEILICFLRICECVFETSFLLTLDIYKTYFRSCHIREHNGEHMQKVIDTVFSLKEAIASLRLRVL